MNVGTKVPQVQLISHIVSDEQTELQKRNTGMNISESDLINLTLELEAQLSEVKSQNEELMQALENREAANKKYTSLFENNPCGLFILSENGVIAELNSAGAAILDKKKSLLINRNFKSFISDESKAEFNNCFNTLFETHCRSKFDVKLRKPDGSPVFVHIDAAMNVYKVTCYLSVSIIEEQKLADEVLMESEERYRELADSITDDFFSLDTDLKFTYCNKSFKNNIGIKATDIIGKSIYDVFPDIKGSLREMVYLDVLKTQQPGSCIDEFLYKGVKKYFEIKTYPSKKGLVVFIYDVNHRMQTEKELTLFKSIIESSNASVAVSDPHGKVIYVNPACAELFGRSLEEAASLSFEDYHPSETLSILKDEMLPALKHGKSWEGEIEVFHKNGQKIPIWSHAGSIQDDDGQNIVLFSILDDISDQKKAEKDKLHLELIKGEEAERLRIAHDLHNHIGHIIVAIKIHIERAIASSADEKHIAQLENILDKVIFAIKEVRLVSSKLAERFSEPWKLRHQISTFLTDLEITSNIQIVQKIDPLPDEVPDPLMRNVVGILEEALSNVMKHSDAKSVYIHVFIKKNRFFINIRDNGKGMDNSLIHHGSGLSFLKAEAELIDGEISIKSVPGKFCMLKFNAPITAT